MDPITIAALSIVSVLAVTASITSICSCYRTEQFMKKMTTEATAVDISNKVTHKTSADGSITDIKEQHIRIDEADISNFTTKLTAVETGRDNAVANSLASGAVSTATGFIVGSLKSGVVITSPPDFEPDAKAILPLKEEADDNNKLSLVTTSEVKIPDTDDLEYKINSAQANSIGLRSIATLALDALADGDLSGSEMIAITGVVLNVHHQASAMHDGDE